MAPDSKVSHDWLLAEVNTSARGPLIPMEQLEALERAARQPFLRLAGVDVLERWQRMTDPRAEVQKVAGQAMPFLDVNAVLAERGNRPEIQKRSTVIAPVSSYQSSLPIWPCAPCAKRAR